MLCNKYLSLLPDYVHVLGKFTVYECNEFKISLSRVKSIYTGIHVYMPVAKNYKIAFIIV